jgi:cyclase
VLKTRIMPTLLYRDHELVKGVGFDSWRGIGSVLQAVRVYSLRMVDELVFLDIGATRAGHGPDPGLIEDMARECFMPLTVGGGVRRVEDVRRLLRLGADKVAINSAAVEEPGLIEQAAHRFGSQCLVLSIDARRQGDGRYEVFIRSGTTPTGLDPVEHARRGEAKGAGEILLTSIERDGTMQGYDLELLRRVTAAVSIPVIASGGAGSYEHMVAALNEGGAHAVAAAALFHFTEATPREAKLHLRAAGLPVRL